MMASRRRVEDADAVVVVASVGSVADLGVDSGVATAVHSVVAEAASAVGSAASAMNVANVVNVVNAVVAVVVVVVVNEAPSGASGVAASVVVGFFFFDSFDMENNVDIF